VIASAREKSQRVVFYRDKQIFFAHGAQETSMLSTDAEPIQALIQQGGISLSTLCAAVAVANCLDISADLIRAGLKSFSQKSAVVSTTTKGASQ
jgi:hypothetical protein